MIEGLKLKVTSTELNQHLTARSEHHRQRAKDKASELEKLRAIADKLAPELNAESVAAMTKFGNSQYNADPRDLCSQMETDIRNHNNQSLAFKFFAEHLFSEDYTLTESDLQRIEILRR